MFFKRILSNKIFWYLSSRYSVFLIQFITSIYLARILGPKTYGYWGFILLILNYFYYFNLGVDKSLNVLLIQNRSRKNESKALVANSFFLIFIIAVFIGLVAITIYLFEDKFFDQYRLGSLIFLVLIIALLFHFNSIMGTIYRVYNRLFELTVFQSIIPVITFVIVLSGNNNLIELLLYGYILGHLISFILFVVNGKIPSGGKVTRHTCYALLYKGFYLFLYNLFFYLILLSTRSIISIFYTVEEFGTFTIAFTIGNSVLMLLQALSIVVFPKVIDKLKVKDTEAVVDIIHRLNEDYVTLSYFLMLIALFVFPLFVFLLQEYEGLLMILNIVGLTLLLFTNSFGHVSHLIAWNHEKELALISFLSLTANISLAYLFVVVFSFNIEYVALSTLFSYFLFGLLTVRQSSISLGLRQNILKNIRNLSPVRLLFPYLTALLLCLTQNHRYYFIVVLVFCVMNFRQLLHILFTIKSLYFNPSRIDLR